MRIRENVGTIQDEVDNMRAVPWTERKTKRHVKPTEKGKKYKMGLLEKRRSKLVSRVIKKSREIVDLIYSFQNSITVKEELEQLKYMFKMLVGIHEEIETINNQYAADELWFEDTDQKVFSFKHKVHIWLREVEK